MLYFNTNMGATLRWQAFYEEAHQRGTARMTPQQLKGLHHHRGRFCSERAGAGRCTDHATAAHRTLASVPLLASRRLHFSCSIRAVGDLMC